MVVSGWQFTARTGGWKFTFFGLENEFAELLCTAAIVGWDFEISGGVGEGQVSFQSFAEGWDYERG